VRLPWPFGRSASSDGRSPESGGPVPAPAGPTPAPATGAWAALPPIQRTAGAAPLVAPSKPFLADVPGHNPLPPIVEPLGHETGPGAPPGLVVAQARPVPSLTSSAPLPTRPIQPRAAPGVGDSGSSPWAAVVPTAGDATPTGPDGGSAAAMPAIAPVRTLGPITAAATVRPAARPLTQAPPLASSVQRSARGAQASSSGAPGGATGRAPSPPAAPGGDSGPSVASSRPPLPFQRGASRWSEGGSRRSEGSTPDRSPAEAGAMFNAPSPARNIVAPQAPARRPGLGAPMSVPPATAVAQRLPMRNAGTRQLASATGPGSPGSPPTASRLGRGPAPALPALPSRALPVLPVARQRSGEPARSAERPSATSLPAPVRGSATAGVAHEHPAGGHPASLPTLGARPLRPVSVTAQRQAAGAPTETASVRHEPVPARWTSHDELPATITAQRQPDVVPGVPEPVRLGSAGPGFTEASRPAFPSGPAGAGAGASREIVFPPRDEALSGAGEGATRAAPAVQRLAAVEALRVPSRSVGAPLTLARPGASPGATAATVRASQAVTPAGSPSSSATTAVGGSTGEPAVQATRIETGPGLPAFTAIPVVQRIDGTSPTPSADADERSDAELDELAGALFGRIRAHLRSEVIHEREARGLTFDAF